MIPLVGGVFSIGPDVLYPEKAPVRQVSVGPFWLDETPVTNAEFALFLGRTGHITDAELTPDPRQYPGMLPELAIPGSLVFEPLSRPLNGGDKTGQR
ncbi:hypothetical protein IP81_16540 [Novosphingobium sp. AAP83]|uniref:SUMF1/EgtB/PvdO family nonheme iron enzyme n=1 Tax=Novosphingobium sp. AAP83 TaxID=1523425 RepID=UPI0006B99F79|nr:SUMF1/EgtB/PvdO family nonheme iron enzyme [Novosphingobium sp. AAP83]KPF89584.1 hypothetical protein IP81_16540 [Novosphingobium sp. AAP83]